LPGRRPGDCFREMVTTPNPQMHEHALRTLEFAEALRLVAGYAASAAGRAAVESLRPLTAVDRVEEELLRVEAMGGVLERAEGRRFPDFPDVRPAVGRLSVEGAVLEGEVLLDIEAALHALGEVREMVSRGIEENDPLSGFVAALADLERERAEIHRAIDERGEVRDDASPELRRIRRELQTGRARIAERLRGYLASLPDEVKVADASVSVREGRFVIAVRREERGRVEGVVHGESASGATLFVEPTVAIEMMNRLRGLEADERREVLLVLRRLSDLVRRRRHEVAASVEALVELDSLHARARYADAVKAVRPRMVAAAEGCAVVAGRHPLLPHEPDPPVPFDLVMEPDERTLLVSGPNTGGKTVFLKALGLLSLLAQSGVIPPVGPETRLAVFDSVFADIGDEQSIEASLSTFSAHLRNLREILERAGPGSLVLIDEIGSGTDPTEGAALAQAILLSLTRRGALTVATTHLGQLKLLAGEHPAVVNASLDFDAERLAPTYRMVKGRPGRSYGIAIAQRLGLDVEVVEEAETYLPEGERDIGRLLLDLEAREKEVARLQSELDAGLARTRGLEEELDGRERALSTREKDAERRARQQARDLLLQARREVEEAIQTARTAGASGAEAEDAARAARRRVEEAASRQQVRAPAERPARGGRTAPPAELAPGQRVRIAATGGTGTVAEVRDGRAVVETGGLRMRVDAAGLEVLPDQEGSRPRQRSAPAASLDASMDAHPEVDLRGLRIDEAEARLGPALDAAHVAGLSSFRIIHGKGTGALRAWVREFLERDPRIEQARIGERFEGGTGVTVVDFR
jgi:DNA mismatch repair protein MutS2